MAPDRATLHYAIAPRAQARRNAVRAFISRRDIADQPRHAQPARMCQRCRRRFAGKALPLRAGPEQIAQFRLFIAR